jgi:two-component system sensor histidine kinase KdpD
MITTRDLQEPDRISLAVQVRAFGLATVLVAGATVMGLAISPLWGQAPVVLLFLPAVLAAALAGGKWPAMSGAVGAALAYNYFFTAPYRTLLIHDPGDVVTVGVLLLTGVVTSHLASSVRAQARLAAAHAARNATIAGFSRKLLACTTSGQIADVTAVEFAEVFGCSAVFVESADSPRVLAAQPASTSLAPSDIAAATLTLTTGQTAGRGVGKVDLADWQFRAIATTDAVLAAVGLARGDGVPPVAEHHENLAASMLDQVALAFERARMEGEARDLATLRERDRLRLTLLASIGEDVKPRLHAIAGAARALRRGTVDGKAPIATIASETTRLERYVDDLVLLEPGSVQEPMIIGNVAIDLFGRRVTRDGETVHLTPKEFALLAELARHAGRVLTHGHLLRSVWGPAHADHVDYLRVAISALRQKLEQAPNEPVLIVNEPAVGYRLALA